MLIAGSLAGPASFWNLEEICRRSAVGLSSRTRKSSKLPRPMSGRQLQRVSPHRCSWVELGLWQSHSSMIDNFRLPAWPSDTCNHLHVQTPLRPKASWNSSESLPWRPNCSSSILNQTKALSDFCKAKSRVQTMDQCLATRGWKEERPLLDLWSQLVFCLDWIVLSRWLMAESGRCISCYFCHESDTTATEYRYGHADKES